METSLHSFLVSIPVAIALWALMLLGVAVAVARLARPPRSAPAPGLLPALLPDGDPVSDDPVADDLRFAGEVSVAASRAAATAARARSRWEDAQQELDAAWTAFEEADGVAARFRAATAFPLLSRRRPLGENVDRERYLHHAATVACRQRQLSIAQLNDIYAHRGWNPRLHPVVQEAALRNAIRAHRFAGYQQAQRHERLAWQNAEIAAEALRVLRAEAAAALTRTATEQPPVSEFWWAEQWTTSELPAVA